MPLPTAPVLTAASPTRIFPSVLASAAADTSPPPGCCPADGAAEAWTDRNNHASKNAAIRFISILLPRYLCSGPSDPGQLTRRGICQKYQRPTRAPEGLILELSKERSGT